MKVGDIIKSYDFPQRADCYKLGEVTKVDDSRVHFNVIKHVYQGEPRETYVGGAFNTPLNGKGMFDDMPDMFPGGNRVVVLG